MKLRLCLAACCLLMLMPLGSAAAATVAQRKEDARLRLQLCWAKMYLSGCPGCVLQWQDAYATATNPDLPAERAAAILETVRNDCEELAGWVTLVVDLLLAVETKLDLLKDVNTEGAANPVLAEIDNKLTSAEALLQSVHLFEDEKVRVSQAVQQAWMFMF